jgi:hypothetical protein
VVSLPLGLSSLVIVYSGKVAGGMGNVFMWFLSYDSGILVVTFCYCVRPMPSSRTAAVAFWPPLKSGDSRKGASLS